MHNITLSIFSRYRFEKRGDSSMLFSRSLAGESKRDAIAKELSFRTIIVKAGAVTIRGFRSEPSNGISTVLGC
jgi:hypothetical protein